MTHLHDDRFPNETGAYRAARDTLLAAEMELRAKVEEVAALRRTLPRGGALKEDYLLTEGPADLSAALSATTGETQTRFSELFAPGKDTLIVYSFMYPEGGNPCPACTSLIDGLDGLAPHLTDRMNFAVFAKTPVADFRAWAQARGWRNVRLLSTNGTSYNTDYVTERDGSDQIPIINVFKRTPDGIFHSWGSELFYAPAADGQHPRHADMIWPVWNLLDMTPEGRDGWFPRNSYD
ncbi:MAG: DUF899 family protein [Rhodospirillaceae bacterium]|jgi:predicted dithiol-disulfide oxidoreductase (DUF899 family)|nr:DUF899 family protein [Rhodospirillaceae bacterium]MBT3930636.1 DUF899 family protein [Rhodospirillaceae bacterium]MBT4771168.1 DUF899 family protein [Rhodospirillaceae bacterium]MBT5357791.1 DUF899 family protein [Rhodospirillaceae bacterium]MBT5770098.1 DUF899 family protein [Rhodospirillaceae bacterium]